MSSCNIENFASPAAVSKPAWGTLILRVGKAFFGSLLATLLVQLLSCLIKWPEHIAEALTEYWCKIFRRTDKKICDTTADLKINEKYISHLYNGHVFDS